MGSRIIDGLPAQAMARQSRTRRAGAAIIVALTCLLALCLPASPASAHSVLLASTPADSSVLATPPTAVRLEFDQPVLAEYADAAVTAGGRDPVEIVPVVDGSVVTIELPAIDAVNAGGGAEPWQVSYRLVSVDDGHPVGGTVTFMVGSGAASPAASDARHDADGLTSTTPGWVLWWIGGAAVVASLLGALLLRRRAVRSPTGVREVPAGGRDRGAAPDVP